MTLTATAASSTKEYSGNSFAPPCCSEPQYWGGGACAGRGGCGTTGQAWGKGGVQKRGKGGGGVEESGWVVWASVVHDWDWLCMDAAHVAVK